MKKHNYFLAILLLLGFSSCDLINSNSNKDKENIQANIELAKERAKIELEKEKLRIAQENQQLKTDRLKAIQEHNEAQRSIERANALERRFEGTDYAIVKVKKTYFHTQPNSESANTKFLVSGDECTILKTKNGFGYIEFYNYERGKTTTGWIDLADLNPVYDEPGC